MAGGRNDSILYSGQTARREADVMRERREERANEAKKQREALLPAAQIVLTEIAKERAQIAKTVMDYVTADKTDDNIKAELLGMKHYDESLRKFQIRIENILRPRPISPRLRRRVANVTVEEGLELDV